MHRRTRTGRSLALALALAGAGAGRARLPGDAAAGEAAETKLLWRNTRTTADAPQVGEYLRVAPVKGRPWQPVRLSGEYRDGLGIDLGSDGLLGVRAWHR